MRPRSLRINMVKTCPDIKRAILLLRYHHEHPLSRQPIYESSTSIANKLNLSTNQVESICRQHFAKLIKVKE